MRHCIYKQKELTIQSFDSCKQLPEVWDQLLPSNHYLQTTNINVEEQANHEYIRFKYLVISIKGKVVALAQFQLLHIKRKHLNEESLSFADKLNWRIFSSVFNPKLLIAGHLFRHDISAVYFSESLDVYTAYKVYAQAIEFAMNETNAWAVLIKDVPVDMETYFRHYSPKYIPLRNDISMVLSLKSSWNKLGDYEKDLKHKYAQRYRKIRKGWENVTVRELNINEIEKYNSKLYSLYEQVCKNQQVHLGKLSENYLILLKKAYPNMLKVWGIFYQDELIGFYSAWIKEDVFDMFYIGLDYSFNKQLHLYFNILFCTIEESIKYRKQRLVLGRTALDAKARLGCKAMYLSTFMYIRNPILRRAVLQLQSTIQENEGEWEQRHPFKE